MEFVSDRMSYIVLRGHWHNIIVSNARAPSEKKIMIQKKVYMRN